MLDILEGGEFLAIVQRQSVAPGPGHTRELFDLALCHGGSTPILDLSREQITALAFDLGQQAVSRASAVDGIALPVAEAPSCVHHARALCDGHASGDQPPQTPVAALLASVLVAKTQEPIELPASLGIAENPAVDRLRAHTHGVLSGVVEFDSSGDALG